MTSRDDKFAQPVDAIEVVDSGVERLQRARARVITGEDADAVAAELAAEDVAAEADDE